jgi:signal transduction histidine kinase
MRTVSWPWVGDAVLAIGLTAVTVFQGLDDPSARWQPFDATAMVLSALATLPTAVRRLAPVPVLLIGYGFWSWQIALGYNPVVTTYGMLLAMYTVAATQPGRRTFGYLAVGGGIWIAVGIALETASAAAVILQGVFVPAAIWKAAVTAKQLAEANDQLRRDREERARRAVTDERVRIARELHDVVAHHMSVIAVQAGLARYVLRTDPATADAAMGTVLSTSSEALDEMRRMLALLRIEPETAFDPAPGIDGLPGLYERVRAAGVPVRPEVVGEPYPLPSGVELCVYRIVQESLTNVLKHAAPATATVTLGYQPGRFTAVVRDDGAGPPRELAGRTGHGLIGMQERAMLYGGSIDTGRSTGGGFEVRLSLPVPAAPPRERGDGQPP